MADYFRAQTEGVPNTMQSRYEDMGDGSHALVMSVDGSDVGLVAGTAVQIVDVAGDLADVDSIVGAFHTIDVLHHEIHLGTAFFVSFKTVDATPLADNATLIFALTIGAKAIHVISTGMIGGDGEKEVLEGSTITGGTATTVYNRNRTFLTATTVTVVRDPTVNAAGTLIDNQFIPGGTGGQTLGGTSGPRNEWVFKPATVYAIRMTNRSGNVQPASLAVEWYEED